MVAYQWHSTARGVRKHSGQLWPKARFTQCWMKIVTNWTIVHNLFNQIGMVYFSQSIESAFFVLGESLISNIPNLSACKVQRAISFDCHWEDWVQGGEEANVDNWGILSPDTFGFSIANISASIVGSPPLELLLSQSASITTRQRDASPWKQMCATRPIYSYILHSKFELFPHGAGLPNYFLPKFPFRKIFPCFWNHCTEVP